MIATRPHHPGRIPVVFVHGTYSSPGRWAEMINVLDNDPRIHSEFEPWFFFYNSSNPILYSSYLLRKNLTEAVKQMDPTGGDACLRDMVVIGHSQGGLLTKVTVVNSGDAFWKNASKKPFEEVQMKDELRETVRQIAFVEPLPFVHRVVFISTPHRGSYLASRDLIRRLIASLVSLPKRVTTLTTSLASTDPSAITVTDLGTMTAIDNMSPKHRFVKTLAGLPIAPGVAANSIIPVKHAPIESGQRRRRRVFERAHRRRRVGEGDLGIRPLHAGQSRDHRGSPPDPPRARRRRPAMRRRVVAVTSPRSAGEAAPRGCAERSPDPDPAACAASLTCERCFSSTKGMLRSRRPRS